MLNDLDVIVKQYPHDWDSLRVYAIGDVHVGAENFNERAIRKKIDIIRNDEFGVVCLCGDLGDYGLKNSKTNVYKATMQPKEQQEYIYELFKPIADKMVSVVPGNHEERLVKETGIDPMLTLCCRWGIEDVYRENMAITKYSFGSIRGKKQQNVFFGVTTHGTTRNKHKKFLGCIDGMDFSVSGHTHTPEYSPHGRIRIERNSGTANHVPYEEIVVDANLMVGGYGLKKEYEIPPPAKLQYIELKVVHEGENRTTRRIMDYHAIQV